MKLALLGYGKMGKTIEKLALEKGHVIVYKSGSEREEGSLSNADAAVEFSSPEAAVKNISKCLENDIPVVSGTTGWLEAYDRMLKLCKERNGSLIYASNFSIGVNLFFSLNEYLAKQMNSRKEYDVAITEIHHTEKKDAPSGTAISLADGIIKHSEKQGWDLGSGSEEIIKITSIREGDVKGTHEILYRSEVDSISIRHEAHNREGFAKGAILAAEWLQHKKGVYSMKDVLGLDKIE